MARLSPRSRLAWSCTSLLVAAALALVPSLVRAQDRAVEAELEQAEAEIVVDAESTESRLVGSPRYLLESIEVVGNRRTRSGVIRLHVPLERGDVIDADSGDLEVIEWRLRGTGWFDEVHLRLRRGSERGWVVLVVEVRERNTMVIRDLVFGISEGLSGSRDPNADILPYVGFS
ncbi:MAG: hypothetical protein H5U40_03270, partial [Polyangiaceae bacterium]|nr:hypothetical protein [Polyangiaceae bacterium]